MSNPTAPVPGSATPVILAADPPQRYSGNYARYLQQGGLLRPQELVAGFTAGGANRHDMARFYFFCLAFDQIVKEGLGGDLLEVGAYKGNTATLLAAMARKLGRTAYVLDTFEGFHPADLTGIDATAPAEAFADTSLEAVRALVGDNNVRFIKGHFPGTAAQLPADGRYCLVHVDCDLFAPVRSALEYFYPRLVPGGFIVVHDYSSLCWSGAAKAVDEFFADKTEAPTPLPDSAGSIVVRKARSGNPSDNWLLRKRAALLRDEWVAAGHGGLGEVLGEGWASPEEWGVWGIGPAHELNLVLPPPIPREFELDFEVHAVLLGSRTRQQVEISANGRPRAVWEFTPEANRGVRRLRIRTALSQPPPADRYAPVTLVFKPAATESPRRLAPEYRDDRPLGMALHRIRYRAVS